MNFPTIDPILFSIGPLHIRWYGLMYVIGFLATFSLVKKQIKDHNFQELDKNFENLNLTLIICVILGGRLGYVMFYNFSYYIQHPLEIPATWTGGMSFHGACLTLIIGGWLFCKKQKLDFWKSADIYVATIPIGLGLGRIGNFINGELFGRVSDVPWAMVFPHGGPLPRHPSQLYEFALEGIALFLLLWLNRNKPWRGDKYWPHGSIIALFLTGYGCFRIFIEFFREPDQQLGYLAGGITMGQILSLGMVVAGILLWGYRLRRMNSEE